MPEPLHLVKIPLRPDKLIAVARRRGIPLRDLDDGYLCHCVLRELWQESAPTPFVLRGQRRTLDVWGYSRMASSELIDHARTFGDPALLAAIADLDGVESKPMPRLQPGRVVGFRLRACPIVRLAQAANGHLAGAEIDAFLARCFAVGNETSVSREQVYRDWLRARVDLPETTGVTLRGLRVAGMKRDGLVRRTQGAERRARRIERPDVQFEGELVVDDGDRFLDWLAHGVGRHRAFGFGAVILIPPGATRAV